MIIRTLHQTSAAIFGNQLWRNLSLRARFWLQGLVNFRLISQILESSGECYLARTFEQDPHLLGVLVWPLVDARWQANRRLQELIQHYEEASSIGSVLSIDLKEVRTLLNLDNVLPTLNVSIERQTWFNREGQLVLSLFHDTKRVFSVAFLLSRIGGERVAYIGAIQGVKQSKDSTLYKNITKGAYGLRPRDLIISMFLVFCDAMNVRRVLAVRDQNRQHRHSYFGRSGPQIFANYDDIWNEFGAILDKHDFFTLSPGVRSKPLELLPAKKRSMYRHRYQLLEETLTALRQIMQDDLSLSKSDVTKN